MKIEMTISNWQRIDNRDVVLDAASALTALAKSDNFEQQSQSVKQPKWHIDNYGKNGLELSIVIKK